MPTGEKSKGLWADPVYRAKQSAARKKSWTKKRRKAKSKSSKEVWARKGMREKLSETMKAIYADDEIRNAISARNKAIFNTPEMKQRCREVALAQFKDPRKTKRHKIAMKKAYRAAGLREMSRERAKAMWDDPEMRDKLCEGIIKVWCNDYDRRAAQALKFTVDNPMHQFVEVVEGKRINDYCGVVTFEELTQL